MKELVKLIPINHKGLKFIKRNGSYHDANIKSKGLIIHTPNNKIIVKHKKDKRFIVEREQVRLQPYSNFFD